MTKTFDRFMKQAASEGREYGDGFNLSHFKGLTAEEKEYAVRVLEERALDGDTIAISAIGFVEKSEAINLLEKVLENGAIKENKAINQASFEAYKITKNRKYIARMFLLLDLLSGQERWHCIQLLCSIGYGDNWGEEIKASFVGLLHDEKDEFLRHSVAKKILLESGVLEGSSIYKEKISHLISSDRNARERVLSDL